jgi:hypothetical protein
MARELAALRARSDARGFDIAAYCAGHMPQYDVITAARSQSRMLLMMARQTGKSWSICGAHGDRAILRPGSTNLFFGLTGPSVRNTFWEPVWKPACQKWKWAVDNLDTTMTARWANGSRTLFSGTDDVRHVQNVLGGRLDGSLVSIDECQSQPRGVLTAMLTSILPPMLTPTSTLLLAGTIPEAPGGPWWVESQKSSWWQRSWGRLDNVHTPEARVQLDAHLEANGLTELDPQIQRDWFGNRNAFDPLARAYHYREERNGYVPTRPPWVDRLVLKSGKAWGADPPAGIDVFSVALDPGASDPCGVVILGWSSRTGGPVYHLFDWVSEYNARLSLDDMVDVVRQARDAIGGRNWQYRYDTNSQNEINAFQHSHGIPSIKAAQKMDMAGQIRRTNNMLGNASLVVIRDSNLAQDFVTARLDKVKLGDGKYDWTNDYHPTASECARYALAGFWDALPVSKPMAHADPFEAEMARKRALENVPAYLRKRTANGWRM